VLGRVVEQVGERHETRHGRLVAKLFQKLASDAVRTRALDGTAQSRQVVASERAAGRRTGFRSTFGRAQDHAAALLLPLRYEANLVGTTTVNDTQQSTNGDLCQTFLQPAVFQSVSGVVDQ